MQNELYHYGVKGMKWGVRRDRVDVTSSISAKKKKNIAREIDKNSLMMKNYTKAINTYGDNSPQVTAARKRVNEHDKRLRKQVKDYLNSLSKQKVDSLVKFDTEHGRHYVELKAFDKKWDIIDDGIYID